MQKNDDNRITHIFFMKGDVQNLLKINLDTLIMNCTYKTNKYKLSLLVISNQTIMHITFYVNFVFLHEEVISDYVWILIRLLFLYIQLMLFDSTMIIIDMKKTLISIIDQFFSFISHLLCLWHINKNVLIRCKSFFVNKKTWDVFFATWNDIIHVIIEFQFWELWKQFCVKYNFIHDDLIEYLIFIYIIFYRRRFVICYINEIFHFNIIFILQDEKTHANLKRQLRFLIDDIKMIVNNINLLLTNQFHNHRFVMKKIKMRFFMKFRKSIFNQLIAHVILYALWLILLHYQLLID